jgi:hypothetical protein
MLIEAMPAPVPTIMVLQKCRRSIELVRQTIGSAPLKVANNFHRKPYLPADHCTTKGAFEKTLKEPDENFS